MSVESSKAELLNEMLGQIFLIRLELWLRLKAEDERS